MAHDRPLVLNGPPGSGKSVTGPALAARLGYAHVDLDELIERAAGSPVHEIFARDGEATFRAWERDALSEALRDPRVVVSAGGGALVDRALRRDVLRGCTVVSLTAPVAVLVERLRGGPVRPLLADAIDPTERLASLVEARREAYAEAHLVCDTSRNSIDDTVARAASVHARSPLVTPMGERSYRVEVAPVDEGRHELASLLASPKHGALVTDRKVAALWPTVRAIPAMGARVELPTGERAKSFAQLSRVLDASLAAGADRRWLIACLGGGVVSDLGGFAAATLLRGVRYVSLPTTLLAMVDASVGGKTAVNHARGKNLIGAFHHPSLVWIDPAFTRTLPKRDWRAGMAEALKVAVALDASLLATIERHADALCDPPTVNDEHAALRASVIRAAVQAKIDVVAVDERESGPRMLLNFGHTVGHAVESASRYKLRHGECVAIGMVAALDLGVRLGVTPVALRDRVVRVIEALKLPTRAAVPAREAWSFLTRDKKRDGDTLRFVLATGAGSAIVRDVPAAEARRALRSVIAQGM